ncbi:esterase-like activity of phytase family protein [Synechococcus sp. CCY9201]|uniref:esterase-like activity of phytase family protein n=1 Tax=Synechococcus sp. CCY9201 TaxID=174697 RepID=UPI002B20D705|nr:esterase-like activity of phytase family protein [Synechococcus sp. CCY9201]MEA5472801.1 esterase-like activity of phytase family protein [Synechococcus sp. CCY9201]
MIVAAPVAPPADLPCPLSAGWQLLFTQTMPRRGTEGEPIGGFSGAVYEPEDDVLWLISDTPRGQLLGWRGLRQILRGPNGMGLHPMGSNRKEEPQLLQLFATIPLQSGEAGNGSGSGNSFRPEMDGEGLVLQGSDAWVASEGRLTPAQPARLLRFDRHSGALRQAIPLPEAWHLRTRSGLAPNGGPESLTLLPSGSTTPNPTLRLLMATEQPLLQDSARERRTLLWSVPASSADITSRVLPPLLAPDVSEAWGLTDLLALSGPSATLPTLALWRSFTPPGSWRAELSLVELQQDQWHRKARWDLISSGLPPDNWEGLTQGPTLADGRSSFVLVSDDNFNPFQQNLLAVIAPRHQPGCSHQGDLAPSGQQNRAVTLRTPKVSGGGQAKQ